MDGVRVIGFSVQALRVQGLGFRVGIRGLSVETSRLGTSGQTL